MNDTLHKIAYDGLTAVTTAGGVAQVHPHSSGFLILVASAFAPVVRDLLVKGLDILFSSILKKKS